MSGLTVEEAVAWLDPPVTAATLRKLIEACEIEPTGIRHTGRAGRPASCYPVKELMMIHAAFIPLMTRHRGVNPVPHAGKVPS